MKWDIDTTHSSVGFSVRHLMISKVHGRFTRFGAEVSYDPASPERASVEAWAEAASIDTGTEQRDVHLRSADFFDAEKYPRLTFKSTKVERKDDDGFRVTGELTIHGVTRPASFDVESLGVAKDPWGGTRAGFSAKGAISRKDFGMQWNQALEAGGVVVGDKVEIALEVEVVQKAAAVTEGAAASATA